jgi:trigger factor
VRAVFEQNVTEFRKHGRVAGFRPGKAPRDLVVRHYGKRIREETEREVVRTATEQALAQEKIQPETAPRLEENAGTPFREDAAFTFAISFDVAPEFPLPNYRGLVLKRTAVAVDDAQVDKTIQGWLERRTSYQTVARAAQAQDLLKVAWKGQLHDAGVELAEAAKFFLDNPDGWLPLRPPEIIPGAMAATLGRQAGDEVTFEATFPEDCFEKSLAGKSATYTLRILEVQAPQVPELTDDLAKEMGHKDSAEMRGAVRDYLRSQGENRQRDSLRQQLLQALLQVPEFPIPPTVLTRETVQEFVALFNAALRSGRKEAELHAEQDQIMAEARTRAQARLRRSFVLRAVATAEKIELSQDEFATAVATFARMQNQTPQVFLRRVEENGRLGELHEQLRESKTLDHLLTLSTVEDAPAAAAAPAEA